MYSKHLPVRFINEIKTFIHTHKDDYDLDQLREEHGCPLRGLHQELFNTDYYIIGRFYAEEWLGRSSWDAVRMVQEYERDQFGETYTDTTDPERLANMVAYILGEEALYSMTEEEVTA